MRFMQWLANSATTLRLLQNSRSKRLVYKHHSEILKTVTLSNQSHYPIITVDVFSFSVARGILLSKLAFFCHFSTSKLDKRMRVDCPCLSWRNKCSFCHHPRRIALLLLQPLVGHHSCDAPLHYRFSLKYKLGRIMWPSTATVSSQAWERCM